jgi:hypothetical protein
MRYRAAGNNTEGCAMSDERETEISVDGEEVPVVDPLEATTQADVADGTEQKQQPE